MGGLIISGYALEPVRVGGANSPFTQTPDIVISSQGAFDTAYPTAETAPRTDYHVFIREDGKLHDATLMWTKNEVIRRFDFAGRDQRFKTLPGAALIIVGTLLADANTERLSVTPPASSDTASYPLRVSYGTDSGVPFTPIIVALDADFGTPAAGSVEISQETGNLHWNTTDLTTLLNQTIRYQAQDFFDFSSSDGNIGDIDDVLLLNPIPASGQSPLLRIGFGAYLTPVAVASEGGFSPDPTSDTVEWAEDTGRLKFNAAQTAAETGRPVYYDGVVYDFSLTVPTSSVGTVTSPGTVAPSTEGSGIYFRIPSVPAQIAITKFVDDLSAFGKRNEVEVERGTGQVKFSFIDQTLFGGAAVTAVLPDVPIERGISLRLFRSPIDPGGTDATIDDLDAFYVTTGAILADPIIASPIVLLPAVPVDTETISVTVEQGTGSFLGTLPRLDVASPPVGIGYILDSVERQFQFAQRKEDEVFVQSARVPYGAVALDPLLSETALVLEIEDPPGSATFTPLPATINGEAITPVTQLTPGLITLAASEGTLIASGSVGSFSGTTFTDTSQDFTAAGALPGDILIVASGAAQGVYTVDTPGTTTLTTDLAGITSSSLLYEIRRGKEVLADRFFNEVPLVDPNTSVERLINLGTTTNSPRLAVDLAFVDPTLRVRFRFGTSFSTSVTTVVLDSGFTAPASLAQGVVEISLDTGNVNFSADDVAAGLDVFWSRILILGIEYRLQAGLEFVEFVDRMLENEEAVITYVIIDDDDQRQLVVERAVFIVRKELTLDHPNPTDTLFFNPLGREVAINPQPSIFRGGRPQVLGDQVTVNVSTSSMTFQPSDQITDALPAGAIVAFDERVYIDYFIYGAFGGERSFTVLQAPMAGVTILIEDEETSFSLQGDQTPTFPAAHLLRIDNEEVYLIGSSSFVAGVGGVADPGVTTVTLTSPQAFRTDFRNPSLAVSSGLIRTTASLFFPSYFVTEVNSFEAAPRGNNRFFIFGDVSDIYEVNTVIHWTDGGSTFDFNVVTGSIYDAAANKTEIVLTSNNARQYTPGVVTLKRSVRPVLETPSADVTTNRSPLLDQPYTVFRRVEGSIGEVLVEPDDFSINAAGGVSFADPLQDNEELSIIYTGSTVIADGRDFRASYTFQIVPTDSNGLLRQILKLDYTTYAPDTFYWRVETMTNFRAELAQQFEDDATAGVPTGGPTLENASQPSLFEEGRESVYFQERRLANEDLVARPTLKFFNDGVNFLEDFLQSADGRIIGDNDGRFLFDGLIDNPVRTTFADVTNQIDDLMKISEAPITITMPGFIITFIGTFAEVYKPARFSRFFPTVRSLYSPVVSPGAPGTGFETGDTIGDIGYKALSQIRSISRRQPWAVVTKPAFIGQTVVEVDTTDEAEELYRPKWDTGTFDHKVAVQAQDGTFLVPLLAPVEIAAQTATTLIFSAGLAANIPVGATIFQVVIDLLPPAAPYNKFYRPGLDVGVNAETGELTHIQPFPPFDGNFGLPPALDMTSLTGFPATGEVLDVAVGIFAATAPDRVPVLDGGTQDDDRNRQFPILNPSADSENGLGVGYIQQEKALIESGGRIRSTTTAPFIGTGTLSVSETRITLDSGTFPAPAPKVNDLVRITSGPNAGLSYRRVSATNGSTYVDVTGGDAWPSPDTAFTFTVTVSTPLESGAAALTGLTLITDAGATFQTNGVQIGHTVIGVTGANLGLRRQVTSVISEMVLSTTPWPVNDAAMGYSVDDPLSTYGGTGSLLDDLEVALDGELEVLSTNVPPGPYNQQDALELFLDHVFFDVFTGASGETTVGGAVFTDLGVDFTTQGITLVTDFIYMRTGASRGIFQLDPAGVIGATTLPILDDTFPATASGLSYRIVTPESMTKNGLQALFEVLDDLDTVISDATASLTLVTTTVGVLGDAGAFAHGFDISDLDARMVEVTARITDLEDLAAGPAADVSGVMVSTDRLYDRRFTWIDARTNQRNGILTKKDRAVENRLDQQEETLKQLTKLLTT